MTDIISPAIPHDHRHVALILVVKQPVPGRVKTRLTPALSPRIAAAIHELFLHYIRNTCEQLAATMPCIHLVLLFDPPQSADIWNQWTLWRRIPQTSGGLGERMESCLKTVMDRLLDGCIFIGADAPELTADHVKWAVDETRRSHYTMIPAHDGGYVLIGIQAGNDPIFQGISFGTPEVADQTRQAAARLNMTISELPPLHDIDTYQDLTALLKRLETSTAASAAGLRQQVARIADIHHHI